MAQSISRPKYSIGDVLLMEYLGQVEFEVTALGFDLVAKCFCYTLTPTSALPGTTTIFDIGEDALSKTAARKDTKVAKRRKLNDAELIEGSAIKPSKQGSDGSLASQDHSALKNQRQVALSPTQASPAKKSAPTADGEDFVTPARLAHMKKTVSNLMKGISSQAFRLPVDPVGMNIPHYLEVIKEPMDLSTIDMKLKNKQYVGVSGFIRDFTLIVNNCYTFNGMEHAVSQQATQMNSSFKMQMEKIPPVSLVEPSKDGSAGRSLASSIHGQTTPVYAFQKVCSQMVLLHTLPLDGHAFLVDKKTRTFGIEFLESALNHAPVTYTVDTIRRVVHGHDGSKVEIKYAHEKHISCKLILEFQTHQHATELVHLLQSLCTRIEVVARSDEHMKKLFRDFNSLIKSTEN